MTRKLKEHDRGIFTNFLRLKSGDSFNFLNSQGEVITNTEIDIYPLTNHMLNKVNKITLESIERKINKSEEKNKFVIHHVNYFNFKRLYHAQWFMAKWTA